MAGEFFAVRDPSPEVCNELTALAPTNPFYTAPFVQARRLLKETAVIIGVRDNSGILAGCTGFIRTGRLNKSLEIVSVAAPPDGEVFWSGLRQYCRTEGVTQLFVNSFASPQVSLPAWREEKTRTAREEFILDLGQQSLFQNLSSNHARNIKKARKAGIRIRQVSDPQDAQSHVALVDAALHRREKRGEQVPRGSQAEATFDAYLRTGAAVLFQSVEGERVLASVLILLAPAGAYYQSAGSHPEALNKGASHFLVHEVSLLLQERKLKCFNLGGAHEEGLRRFKSGFGATPVALESASYYVGGTARAALSKLIGRR